MFVRFLFFFSDGVSFVSAVEYRWYVDMRGCGIVSDSFLILLSCKNHLLFHGFSFISRQTGYRAHSLRSNNHIICAQLFLRFVCSIDKENYFFFCDNRVRLIVKDSTTIVSIRSKPPITRATSHALHGGILTSRHFKRSEIQRDGKTYSSHRSAFQRDLQNSSIDLIRKIRNIYVNQ